MFATFQNEPDVNFSDETSRRRMQDGLLRRVLPGDVMAKWPFGGLFVAQDIAQEQSRFDQRETVSAGPMFGTPPASSRVSLGAAECSSSGAQFLRRARRFRAAKGCHAVAGDLALRSLSRVALWPNRRTSFCRSR